MVESSYVGYVPAPNPKPLFCNSEQREKKEGKGSGIIIEVGDVNRTSRRAVTIGSSHRSLGWLESERQCDVFVLEGMSPKSTVK